ncbi:MAG: hypothetical protein AAFO07_21150 [Bacteroidota bacterium]
MKLYKTKEGIFIEQNDFYYKLSQTWDTLINTPNLYDFIKKSIPTISQKFEKIDDKSTLPPIGTQEIWASGVTYYKSREARMEEAKEAGGGNFFYGSWRSVSSYYCITNHIRRN